MLLMPVATMSHIFEFMTAFFGLPAVFAVLLDGDAQIVFRFVNIPFTSGFRECGQGRANQADERQQSYAKNSDGTSHFDLSFRTCE